MSISAPSASPLDAAWHGALELALRGLRRSADHDLRSPANALRLNLSLAQRTLEAGTAGRWIDVAVDETNRLEQLLVASSVLSRCPETPSHLDEDVRAAALLLDGLASKKRVEWRLDGAPPASFRWRPGAGRALLATVARSIELTLDDEPCILQLGLDGAKATLVWVEGRGPEHDLLTAIWGPVGGTVAPGEPDPLSPPTLSITDAGTEND